jgi:hypothetical protein
MAKEATDQNNTATGSSGSLSPVLAPYRWPHNLTDEQILERLLTLNLERAAAQES